LAVDMLDLQIQYRSIRDEVRRVIDQVCDSQRFILGEYAEKLESEIARYCQAAYAVGVSSGTDALLVSLMAVGVGPGDEVITTPYTFFATAGTIARLGAEPVFVDVDPETFNISPTLIEPAITEKTKAIIPVHLFGQCADMDPIMDLADRHDLYVIEDAAQAIGARYKGRRACSLGHAGCLSFYPTKNLGGFGEGGMIVTNDEAIAEKSRLIRNHGESPRYHNKVIGGNFRLDALQAGVLTVKLRYLDTWHEKRRHHADRYDRLLAESRVVCPKIRDYNESVYNIYCVEVEQRDKVIAHLSDRRIGFAVYYPLPMHLQECFSHLGYAKGDFANAEYLADHALAIPVYPELTDDQIDQVVAALREIC